MPIAIAPIDVELKVLKVNTDSKTKKRLESLGIVANGMIKVISNNAGNVIVEVKGVRLAINKDVATKILVA